MYIDRFRNLGYLENQLEEFNRAEQDKFEQTEQTLKQLHEKMVNDELGRGDGDGEPASDIFNADTDSAGSDEEFMPGNHEPMAEFDGDMGGGTEDSAEVRGLSHAATRFVKRSAGVVVCQPELTACADPIACSPTTRCCRDRKMTFWVAVISTTCRALTTTAYQTIFRSTYAGVHPARSTLHPGASDHPIHPEGGRGVYHFIIYRLTELLSTFVDIFLGVRAVKS